VSASNRVVRRSPSYTSPCDSSSQHRRLLRLVEGGCRPVYCLVNNVFMLEDALRFQRLVGTDSRELGCSITDLQRPPGVVCHLE